MKRATDHSTAAILRTITSISGIAVLFVVLRSCL
jgi:hypothetical protein